jgi:riboflavin synthase
MFTGLIEAVGEVVEVERTGGGMRLHLQTALARELQAGESLAVNGVCLTMMPRGDRIAVADIGPETARVTTLGELAPGARVNLERAMRADSRFGGHFVQGHVDGVGTVREVRGDGDVHWLAVAFAPELAGYVVPKGSIAVDGVSLTVAALRDHSSEGACAEFEVMLIPFTWDHTSLSTLRPGGRVNLECDMIGKYVARAAAVALNKV